jgi:hypothetical protein
MRNTLDLYPNTAYAHPHLDLRAALANAAAYLHGYPDGDLHADTYCYTDANNYTYVEAVSITNTGPEPLRDHPARRL